ncbi:MAG: LuxR C-terminal-related transcriptional regulator [Anaerolineales bacterium]
MEKPESLDASPILKTKLYPPPITPDMVPRVELLERLERERLRPLTLISAPAGYGKSIFASMWLQANGLPGGWVSLDETDNDLHTFVSYMLAAIQTAVPDKLSLTQALLKSPSLPAGIILARHLILDLDQIETPIWLVLDDIHQIHQPSIFHFLEALLNHPSQVLHLVLVGRQDPPLPIASLRAYQRVTEIRLRDLRFSTDETARFLQQTLNRTISAETATEWTQNTEGWPVALRLAALSLRGRSQQADLSVNIPADNQFLHEYLLAEVLARQPALQQSCLLKTALLDRFCAPLCEAVCQEADGDGGVEMTGERFIQWLQKSNLFLINLDPQNEWFRFHDLFQAELLWMLKRQLSQPEIAALHLRASRWLVENGWISEAMEHALAADDTASAVEIFTRHRRPVMNAENWGQLERWVRLFPENAVEKEPILLLTRTHLPIAYGYDTGSLITQAASLLADKPPDMPTTQSLWAEVAYFTGLGAIMEGQAETAIGVGVQMIDTLPADAFYLRCQALGVQAMGYQMSGNINQGIQIIQAALRASDWPLNVRVRGLFNQIMLYFMEADLDSAQTFASESIQLVLRHNLDASEVRYFAGITHYLRNDLTLAEANLLPVAENPALADPVILTYAACTLTRLYHAQVRPEKANTIFQETGSYLDEIENPYSLGILKAFQVELALDQGDTARAHQLSLALDIDWRLPFWFWHYYTFQLTPIKLWLAEGQELDQALAILEEMDEFLRKMNRKIHRIDVLALQALAYQALDNRPKAMEKIGQSLALAAPGKFIRNYLDLGPKMRALLVQYYKQTQKQKGTDDLTYLAQILAAFPQVKSEDQNSGSSASILIDPLTKRELEVLKLLATDLSTKEMALEMNITWATVRTHSKNIYAKLGVNSRYEAVYRAQEFELI